MNKKYAKRVKVEGMNQIMLDLMTDRATSDVYINQKMDVTELMKYLNEKKNKGEKITFFHAVVTAVGKVFYNRPKLNRFVCNRHMYVHNDVVISFVAKVAFKDNAEEMMVLVKIDPEDNIETIAKKIKDKVDNIRSKSFEENEKKGANNAIVLVGKLPNILRVPIVGLIKWADNKGILPGFLVEDNLYYSSIILSNLGSIHCGAILHHLTQFGNACGLATIGEIKDEEVIIDGKKEIRKICEFGINLDERIADGYYFAKSVQLLQDIFNNPKMLESDCDEEIKVKEQR